MSRRPRRNHAAAFKAKVALEALRDSKTIGEIAQKHDVHRTRLRSGDAAGLGERMLRRLTQHAREHGLRWLVGGVLSDKRAMLGWAAKLGFIARRHAGDATLTRVTLELAGA